MLGTTQNHSTRTLAKGLLCAGMLAGTLLLTLLAGANASAAEHATGLIASTSSTSGPESTAPPPESTAPPPATTEPSSSEAPSPAAPVVEATPPAVQEVVQPPVVTVIEEVLPPPVVTVVEEVLPPPPAPVVQAPEAATPSEAKPPVTPVMELVPEATPKPTSEADAEDTQPSVPGGEAALSTAAPSSGQVASGLTSPPAGPPPNAAVPDTAPVEESSVVLGRLALGAAGRSSGPPGGAGAVAIADRVPVAGLSAAQRAAELSCQLSGMAGAANDNCRAGWLGGQLSLSAQAAGFRAPTGSSSGPPDEGYGDSAGGSHPVMPAPAPAPSGAVGGSAAGGAGVSPAGFFTLAGLLLHAAPRALRRLRLSCEPWRTAFFVLIPERPG